jgi:hypothetical protein
MYFNGFTLLLIIISAVAGFALGLRVEQAFQRNRLNSWLHGDTIEEQMKADGWRL